MGRISYPPRHRDGPVVTAHNLRKTFDGREYVLDGIDLEVRVGETLVIMGPSGCGKSTLLYCLSGLAGVTGGRVWIDGVEASGLSDRRRTALRRERMGFVFQRFNLLPTLSAADNVALAMKIRGRRAADGTIAGLLERMGLPDKGRRLPEELSMGEQQRVAIARAVAAGPAILFADEPTGNLDGANGRVVLDFLRELNRQDGQTILLITHDPEAAAAADRTLRMRDGRFVDEESHP